MARAKVILVDADVISHFIATDHIYELNEILSPHQLYIVDNVYKEVTYHPSDKVRKNKVDEWLENSKACRISFPKLNLIKRRKTLASFKAKVSSLQKCKLIGLRIGIKTWTELIFFLNVEVYFFQPLLYIKARTAFANPWEVTMADDFGIGIVKAEALQEFYHAALLGFGSSIGRIAVGIQAALVTDSY